MAKCKFIIGALLFYFLSSISHAGWFSDATGGIFDPVSDELADTEDTVRDELADAEDTIRDELADAEDTVRDELADLEDSVGHELRDFNQSMRNAWNGFTDWCCGIENDEEELNGFGEEEIILSIDDVYVHSMNNKDITLGSIEGESKNFSWIPIGVDGITTFIPGYQKGVPNLPSEKEIWNNTDSDKDGIYDDIEYLVVRNFSDAPNKRLAAYRYAHSLKQLVDNQDKPELFRTAIINLARAENCLLLHTSVSERNSIGLCNGLG